MCCFYMRIYHWQHTEYWHANTMSSISCVCPFYANPFPWWKCCTLNYLGLRTLFCVVTWSAASQWNALEYQDKYKTQESNQYSLQKALAPVFYSQKLKHVFRITLSCITSLKISRASLCYALPNKHCHLCQCICHTQVPLIYGY